MIVLVVLGLAGVAVLGAVVLLAMGRGGELAATHPDYPPLPLGSAERPVTGAEAAHLRLPRTVWGYQPDLADEAVRRLARALSEREAEVAALQRELAELRYRAGEPVGALFGLHETGPPDGDGPRDAGLDAGLDAGRAATSVDATRAEAAATRAEDPRAEDPRAGGTTPRPGSPPEAEEPRDANVPRDIGGPRADHADQAEDNDRDEGDDRDAEEGRP